MIVYRLYKYLKFEEIHKDYFNTLLETVKDAGMLSSRINEIIFTDDLQGEIERNCKNRFNKPILTRSREYMAISKTIDFDGKKKIYFDALNVNLSVKFSHQIFFHQLIEIYAEDIVTSIDSFSHSFFPDTPFPELLKKIFLGWAIKDLAYEKEKLINYKKEVIYSNVKIFVEAFKRNIRKLHYQYQTDLKIDIFWKDFIIELDILIRRCLDVKYDKGVFNSLQEFSESIPLLLTDIEIQTQQLINNKTFDLLKIKENLLKIINDCFIEITCENPITIHITGSPKKLFKGNLVDTEPRIVAFIDILGFSEIIKEYDTDKTSNILNELHDTLDIAIKISIENLVDLNAKSNLKEFLEYRMFSDCICISLPFIEYGNDFHFQFHSLATVVKSYQLAMLQKGFFVRGGISYGSFYSDKHMIFSGGLVSAYKLEQKAGYPIIKVDEKVISRLKIDYFTNSKNLIFENILIYSVNDPNNIFLNPFDILDNSLSYLDYLQTNMDNMIKEIDTEKKDKFSDISKSLFRIVDSFTKPLLNYAKLHMNKGNMDIAKNEILKQINMQLDKQMNRISHFNELKRNKSTDTDNKQIDEINEINKIISKLEFSKSITEWSLGKIDQNTFKYFVLSES